MALTKQDYAEWLYANQGQRGTKEFTTVERSYRRQFGERPPRPSPNGEAFNRAEELYKQGVVDFGTYLMGTNAGRFVQGAADIPLGAAQLAVNATGDNNLSNAMNSFMEERANTIQQGRTANGGGNGIDIPRMAGNIMLAGAGGAAVKAAPSVGGKILQSGVGGAAVGAASPVENSPDNFWEEKALQAATGALTGAAIPSVMAAGTGAKNVVRNLADPYLPGGVDRAVVRTIDESVDNVGNVIDELKSGGTTAEAISRTAEPRAAALVNNLEERVAKAAAGSSRQQSANRVALLRESAGGSADKPLDDLISSAISTRSTRTTPLYMAAKNSTEQVDASRTVQVIRKVLASDPNNTPLQNAVKEVGRTLVETVDGNTVFSTSPKSLISAAQNIGRIMNEKGPTGQKVNQSIVRELGLIKKSLDRQIEKTVPEYSQANKLYQELSIPVNRAQIAQRLEQKLTPALAGEDGSIIAQRSQVFAGALNDENTLIKQATGFARGSGLEKYFDPEQLSKIELVAKQLKENAEFKALATLGNKGSRRIVGDLVPEPAINPLNRVIMIINGVMKRAGTSRREATLDRAAELFQDPKKLAELLESALPEEQAQIQSLIGSMSIPSAASAAAATNTE